MLRNTLAASVLAFAAASCAHTPPATPLESCDDHPALQQQRSDELRRIERDDQADRAGPYDTIDWTKVNPRDLARRARIATIFAEGCFSSAEDYANAALVFQHGTTDAHYYQAFVWANEAVKRGATIQRTLAAAALDRYLVKTGHKQLFATQFSKDPTGRWCIQPIEPSFPAAQRLAFSGLSESDQRTNILKVIGPGTKPAAIVDCPTPLAPTPRGTVLGLW